ncbi:MAG: hypothetical protein HOP29_11155 [Phycisphaerales bacterium]|nr:hypothetical protein [Phycisphaerales bacterium]
MTRAGIKKAFKGLHPSDQAVVLTELAATLAESLADMDARDAAVFPKRRHEESKAAALADVRRRLIGKRKR